MTTGADLRIDDLPALLAAHRQGARLDYLFFWGHQPDAKGRVTKTCLSQWWPAAFVIDGITYPTAEHYMMTEKARLFGDEEMAQTILQASHPREAKSLGRLVANYDDGVWEQHRFEIVVAGNFAKFAQNDDLKHLLLATSPKILVEASPYDRVWGIGLAANDPQAADPEQWQGLNLLGFALMRVRAQLIRQAKT